MGTAGGNPMHSVRLQFSPRKFTPAVGCPDYVQEQQRPITNTETELLSKFSNAPLRNLDSGIPERWAPETLSQATKIAYETKTFKKRGKTWFIFAAQSSLLCSGFP